MLSMRHTVAIPLPWLVSAVLGTLGGVIVGGLWLGRRVSEEWYMLGLQAGRAEASQVEQQKAEKSKEKQRQEADSDSSSSSVSSSLEQQDFAAFTDSSEECKLVLLVRTDLKMSTGKIAAQCGHATLACYKTHIRHAPASSPILRRWEQGGQMKVALKCTSEEDMQLLQAQALSLGLCARIIHDAGRTQIAAGSATVLGIGPGPVSVVNMVTGHLKLL